MSGVRNTSFGLPHPHEADSHLYMEDRASCPTPAKVMGQIARVITVCLALGLAARILVAFTGVH